MVVTVVIALEQRMFFLGQNMTQAVSYHGQVSEGLRSCSAARDHRPAERDAARGAGRADPLEALDFSYTNARVFPGTST